jgi:hypothetical protein
MIGFLVGVFVGAFIGCFIMGLICAGRDFYDNDGEF